MSAATSNRARIWIDALADAPPQPALGTPSVLSADIALGARRLPALALAVVPDPQSRMPRAAHGEMGLEQAWTIAACIRQYIEADAAGKGRRPILAIVDTPGQAFGRIEEQRCISLACAAAVDAYAAARRAGHPVLTLVVGRAISGSFLAHGLQSDAIFAFGGGGVMMHAMSPQSIARITRRTLEEVNRIAASVLPMSYAIEDAHQLGIIHTLLAGIAADAPTAADIARVKEELTQALNGRDTRTDLRSVPSRAATVTVRERMHEQWLQYQEAGR